MPSGDVNSATTHIEVPGFDVVGIRADNPSPFTLSGTNSWIVGRDPAWLIDPGPPLGAHLAAVSAEIQARGGLGAVVLTHRHADHSEAIPMILERFPGTPFAAAEEDPMVILGEPRATLDERAVTRLSDGSRLGPLEAIATPGHAPDHLAFALGGDGAELVFTGDAVLGEGSVFITPYPGALAAYLLALDRLRRRPIARLAPGHGPVVEDAAAKLDEYIEHRLGRERRLIAALDAGKRSVDELLDDAWSDAPAAVRPAAAATLAAHLDKLADEGRLPDGVERPRLSL
jgi:glyoxylase-like metal-dependent hydrolase (beta-lactamase superfamily II)